MPVEESNLAALLESLLTHKSDRIPITSKKVGDHERIRESTAAQRARNNARNKVVPFQPSPSGAGTWHPHSSLAEYSRSANACKQHAASPATMLLVYRQKQGKNPEPSGVTRRSCLG